MVKHNNVLPNGHFHKKWQRRVRTWFDQVCETKSSVSIPSSCLVNIAGGRKMVGDVVLVWYPRQGLHAYTAGGKGMIMEMQYATHGTVIRHFVPFPSC